MTARAALRRRRTVVGAALAGALVLLAAGLSAVGAYAVVNSTAGEEVAVDDRPVAALPPTDNAALAVVDDQGELTSLVVATLLPAGLGGSIVTVPVDADVNIGFGDDRVSLAGSLDPGDPTAFFQQVEATLAITLEFGEIVGADRLEELLGPTLPIEAVLAVDAIDSSAAGPGRVVGAGTSLLNGPLAVRALQANDLAASERERHSIDVAVWSGAAASAAGPVRAVPTDEFDRPVPAADLDEVFSRLWSGPVQVADLALGEIPAGSPSGVVVLDRRDVALVFGQVSPARVSTPNEGPVFRLRVPMTDGQIGDANTGFTSRSDVALNAIAQLLFFQANVASVDLADNPDRARQVTRIDVASNDFVETMETLGPLIFGEVEVTVADELIDGIDVVVVIGTSYLEARSDDVADIAGTVDDETSDPADTVVADG